MEMLPARGLGGGEAAEPILCGISSHITVPAINGTCDGGADISDEVEPTCASAVAVDEHAPKSKHPRWITDMFPAFELFDKARIGNAKLLRLYAGQAENPDALCITKHAFVLLADMEAGLRFPALMNAEQLLKLLVISNNKFKIFIQGWEKPEMHCQRQSLTSWAHKPSEANRLIRWTTPAARRQWRVQRRKAAEYRSPTHPSSDSCAEGSRYPYLFRSGRSKQEQMLFSYLVVMLLGEMILNANTPKHDLVFLKDIPMSPEQDHNQSRLVDKDWNRLHAFDRRWYYFRYFQRLQSWAYARKKSSVPGYEFGNVFINYLDRLYNDEQDHIKFYLWAGKSLPAVEEEPEARPPSETYPPPDEPTKVQKDCLETSSRPAAPLPPDICPSPLIRSLLGEIVESVGTSCVLAPTASWLSFSDLSSYRQVQESAASSISSEEGTSETLERRRKAIRNAHIASRRSRRRVPMRINGPPAQPGLRAASKPDQPLVTLDEPTSGDNMLEPSSPPKAQGRLRCSIV
ncbi:hypothetical protein BP6252_01627 [Coleophoma cylindrospora]|uniref:Uncharacterized protein n=1 Tax=Coleophoma cylindrospora TaxID=1849047 RepID=A0A3D8STH7_9HELO|nr:hypothetical protein BP6252_01627 [Coleophoma cylindrospora]